MIIKGIKGQELWKIAKSIIPGGNQLLSKRAEIFLPGLWPSYYSRAKGCEIWDLDGKVYYDFAGMGVTACTLGYSDEDVDNAVKNAIDKGSMGTLNSYEEVELALKLIELHPWSEMARFARTGGEACSIAVRIARAASGKDHIAFCGYHGWHDWYLSSNLSSEENLKEQLLPGLNPKGVPQGLKGTSHPFLYNDIDSFYAVCDKYSDQIGTIIMEPQRGVKPKDNFLKKIKEYANKKSIVLIFDEVTSGFHDYLGGKHMQLEIHPDIAIFAKALGNGYPIAAIIGRRAVMDAAQNTFVSSTMWTERIGFTAGLATVNKMEKYDVQKELNIYGKAIKNGWKKISGETNINIKIYGLDTIPYFSFKYQNNDELMTFYIQEMLERGFLSNSGTATTYAYNNKIINSYIDNSFDVFNSIQSKDLDVKRWIKGEIKHSTFKRLNM